MEKRPESYVHRIKRREMAAQVAISAGDYDILRAYKGHLNVPMRSVLHYMIGTAAKCWEEKHDETMRSMLERIRIQAKIIVAYIHKYGPVSKTFARRVIKEEKAEEKVTPADKDAPPEQ